jgi:hypothetical protein
MKRAEQYAQKSSQVLRKIQFIYPEPLLKLLLVSQ